MGSHVVIRHGRRPSFRDVLLHLLHVVSGHVGRLTKARHDLVRHAGRQLVVQGSAAVHVGIQEFFDLLVRHVGVHEALQHLTVAEGFGSVLHHVHEFAALFAKVAEKTRRFSAIHALHKW